MQSVGLKGFESFHSAGTPMVASRWKSGVSLCMYCASREGMLNMAAFLRAVYALLGPHSILRTVFYSIPGVETPLGNLKAG